MKKDNIDITVGFIPRSSTNPSTIYEHLFIKINGVSYHVNGHANCIAALKEIANVKNISGKDLVKMAHKVPNDDPEYYDKMDNLEDNSIDISSDKISNIVNNKVNSGSKNVVRGLLITTAAAVVLATGGCHLAKKFDNRTLKNADEAVLDMDFESFDALLESLNDEQKMFVSESVDFHDDITVLLQKVANGDSDIYKFYNQISTEEEVNGEIVKYNTVDLLSIFAAKIFYNADYYTSEDVLKYTGGDKSVFTGISNASASVTVQLLKKYDSCKTRKEMPDLSLIIDNPRALDVVNHFIGQDGYLGDYIEARTAGDNKKMQEIRTKVSSEIKDLSASDLLNQKNLGVALALQVIANNFELSEKDSIYLLGEVDSEDKGIIGSLCNYIGDRVQIFEEDINKYNDRCDDYEVKISDLKREVKTSGLISNWFNKNEAKLEALEEEYNEYKVSNVGENSVKLSEINALFCKEKLMSDFNMSKDEVEKLSEQDLVQKYYDYLKDVVEKVEPGYVQAISSRMNELINNTYKNAPIQNGGGKVGDTAKVEAPSQSVKEEDIAPEVAWAAIHEYESNGGTPSNDIDAIKKELKDGESVVETPTGPAITTNTKDQARIDLHNKLLKEVEQLKREGNKVYLEYDKDGYITGYTYEKIIETVTLPDKDVVAEDENGEKITDPDTGNNITFNPSDAGDFKDSQNKGTGKSDAGQTVTEPSVEVIEEEGISGTPSNEQETTATKEDSTKADLDKVEIPTPAVKDEPTQSSNNINEDVEIKYDDFEGGSFDGTGAINPDDLATLSDDSVAFNTQGMTIEDMANYYIEYFTNVASEDENVSEVEVERQKTL